MSDLRSLLTGDAMQRQFALALPRVLPVDRFIRCLVTTLNRTPGLAECDRNSVLAGAMTAAQLGLEIDPALGRAYLLPYKSKGGPVAQLIIGYKGYVDLAYRSGLLAGLQAEAVYERDHFVYRLGLSPHLDHVPADVEDRGPLKYAYAVASLTNGGQAWRVLNRAQVAKHRASSQSASSAYSPWRTHEEEMWRKTAIRALASLLPLSPELRDAVSRDEQPPAGYADALTGAPEDASAIEALAVPPQAIEAPAATPAALPDSSSATPAADRPAKANAFAKANGNGRSS